MKKLCVFCGSSAGKNSIYLEEAKTLGRELTKNNMGLVYGGASIGLMGAVADAALENNGKAWGVIPQAIVDLEIIHTELTECFVVNNMHDRKAKMYDLSDAFVALPGGMGTMDEFCEIVTWAQLKYHDKPCFVLNTTGYFDKYLEYVSHMNAEGFFSDEHMNLFKEVKSVDELIEHLK